LEIVQRAKGFSLVELLIVLVILAIASALAAPNVTRWLESYRLQGTARQLMTDLQFARMGAISGKVECRVSFDAANNKYTIAKGNLSSGSTSWTQVGIDRKISDASNPYYAKGVTLSENFQNHYVILTPSGEASQAGTVTFTTQHYSKAVTVTPSGRLQIG